MSQMLKGIYFTIEEALAAIDNLKMQGHTPSEITVVASEDFHDSFPQSIDAGTKLDSDVIFDEIGSKLSIWDKVTDFSPPLRNTLRMTTLRIHLKKSSFRIKKK